MKYVFIIGMLVFVSTCAAIDDTEKVTIPKSMLTRDQLSQLNQSSVRDWVGLGKEIGEAVNSSLQAITTQSNNFAQTSVGKLTVMLVIWKVIGDQLVHILTGILELCVFLPLWIWSYRKTCMTRSFTLPDKTVKVVEYSYKGEISPRMIHAAAIALLMAVFLFTTFSYS